MIKRIRASFRRSNRRRNGNELNDVARNDQLEDDDLSFEPEEDISEEADASIDSDLSIADGRNCNDIIVLQDSESSDHCFPVEKEDFLPARDREWGVDKEWDDSGDFLPVIGSELVLISRHSSLMRGSSTGTCTNHESYYGSITPNSIDEIPTGKEPLLASDMKKDRSSERSEQEPFTLERSKLGIFASLTFNWFVPMLQLGNSKEQLDPKDLDAFPLPPSCTTKNVSDAFESYWNEEKNIARKSQEKGKKYEPSIAKCLYRAYGKDYLQAGFLKLIHDMNVFVGPIVLHGLIQFLRDEDAPLQRGLFLTAAVTISQTVMSFCLRHYFFKCYLCGLRMRTAIVVAVYKKALLLSSAERQRRTVGEILNFMTVDSQRIQDLTTYLHAIWYSFLQIGLSIYFLWQQLGPSCLGGVAVIFMMVPVNKVIAAWMGRLQKKLMKSRDLRVDINNEVLGNMKVIKLQAWEGSFQKRILALRNIELNQLFYYVMANSFSIMMWTAVPLLVALATFATYVLSGNTLDVANALTSLALFDILRFPLFMLPQVVNNLVEASISFERVRNFLLSEEHVPVSDGDLPDAGVDIVNGTFIYESKKPKFNLSNNASDKDEELLRELHDNQWEISLLKAQLKDAEDNLKALSENSYGATITDKVVSVNVNVDADADDDYTGEDDDIQPQDLLALRRINFECGRGELIAVVGVVGSGKSTFINSMLGEVKATAGTTAVKGRLAYFPQTPFIMNDTLRRNVTFGRQHEQFDEDRYNQAISASALEHDIQMLSNGDSTEIGEKGITLSGGQKARVALARAVYHDADLYLLDDPLAAVDAHVGKHIFQKCIVDELLLRKSSKLKATEKSSVILVTNAIQYLSNPKVSKIIVLDRGSIAEVGSYSELSTRPDSLFASFLSVLDEAHGQQVQEGPEQTGDEMEQNSSHSGLSIANKIGVTMSSLLSLSIPMNRNSQMTVESEATSDLIGERIIAKGAHIEDPITNSNFPSAATPLMTNEFQEREKGHVDSAIYFAWAKAAGGACVGIFLIFGYAIDQGVIMTSKWWLTYWSRTGGENEIYFLRVYACINLLAIITMFTRVVLIFLSGLRASRILFVDLLENVLKAPMSFFDTTPTGRIVNRFSKDVYTLDEKLVATMRSYLATLSSVFGTIIVVSLVTPYFTLCLVPMLAFYINQQRYFTKTYRELKRIDAVSRSPLYALLGETLDGVSVIRAYNAQTALVNRLVSMLDLQQNAYFLTTTAQCWLAIRLEMVGTLIIFSACLCTVLEHGSQGGNETFAGLAGLSISFALSVTQSLNWSVRMGSDLEAHMVSVERIKQYCRIPTEAPHDLPIDLTLENSWPSQGEIIFSSAKLRYRPDLPLVLKGLDIRIPPQSKVGVVGRTGAGKSTLMTAILRLVELSSGSIKIDGVDIRTVGLNLLRSNIAVIPQDPVLFSGTVRTNLDPFDEFSDDRVNEVLSRVGLLKVERSSSFHSLNSLSTGHNQSSAIKSLCDEVYEGGSNFSVGQRQLLVIARSILRGAMIVIMDEATASVDADTDARIQRVMRTQFQSSTCITVAHRINTILDSDYILVMDDGRAVEFDRPESLMKKGGMFKDLVTAYEEEHTSYVENTK